MCLCLFKLKIVVLHFKVNFRFLAFVLFMYMYVFMCVAVLFMQHQNLVVFDINEMNFFLGILHSDSFASIVHDQMLAQRAHI